MSGGYLEFSNSEKRQADIWRYVSVGIGVLAVVALGWAVYITSHESSPAWDVVSGRYLLALIIGGLSTYAGTQSAEHRKRSVKARDLELKLAAIGPYLATIPERDRDQILEMFTFVFFSDILRPETANEDSDDGKTVDGPSLVFNFMSQPSQSGRGGQVRKSVTQGAPSHRPPHRPPFPLRRPAPDTGQLRVLERIGQALRLDGA
jgi:hypothetical protein